MRGKAVLPKSRQVLCGDDLLSVLPAGPCAARALGPARPRRCPPRPPLPGAPRLGSRGARVRCRAGAGGRSGASCSHRANSSGLPPHGRSKDQGGQGGPATSKSTDGKWGESNATCPHRAVGAKLSPHSAGKNTCSKVVTPKPRRANTGASKPAPRVPKRKGRPAAVKASHRR